MNDLISRQAAIDAIRIFYADECALVDSIEEQLEKLPSAQPQRKTGKTLAEEVERIKRELTDIFTEQMSAQPQRMKGRWTKAYDGYDGHVKCVQCFKTYDWDTQAQYYNFCPNCGSDNRGEDDET